MVDVGNSSVNLNNRISPTLNKSGIRVKMLWSRTVLRYYKVHLQCNCEMTMSNQKYFECTDRLALLLQDILVCDNIKYMYANVDVMIDIFHSWISSGI